MLSNQTFAFNETVERVNTDLNSLMNIEKTDKKIDRQETPVLREESIKETALSIGARAGLIHRSIKIAEELKQMEGDLDKLNFGALMIDKNLMPPVITEGKETVKKDSEDMLKTADAVYRIEIPERLVTVVPTWRDYLYQGLVIKDSGVEKPHDSLLPKTDYEKEVWKKMLKKDILSA